MLTIIHGADFHLDAPFASLTPPQAAERRREQRALLERLADLAIARQADLVLLPGDLLDGDQIYHETAQAMAAALGRIPAPVFLAPGNHDFYAPRSVYAGTDWPTNVHIFRTIDVESVVLDHLNCVVHGAAFTTPLADRSPLMGFSAPADGRTHLMALHGDVDGKGRYGSLTTDDIASSGLAYLALGHVHSCSGLQRAGGTAWAYPGCPEGRGFDELGEKGVLCITIDGDAVAAEFIPLAARRYGILTVPLAPGDDPAAVLADALPGDTGRDIYRVVLTGQRMEPLDLPGLERQISPHFYSVSLRDRTVPYRDLWARAGEDTLTGLFLRDMRIRLDQAEDASARALVEQAARMGLAALENGEDVL